MNLVADEARRPVAEGDQIANRHQPKVSRQHTIFQTKHTDHIVSPLVVNSRMFLVKEGGIATCFETSEGKPLYGPVRINNASNYFASPVYGDGKIFIASENGIIVVLQDGPQFKVLATNDMGDPILGSPAIADGALFIRTRKRMLRIQ